MSLLSRIQSHSTALSSAFRSQRPLRHLDHPSLQAWVQSLPRSRQAAAESLALDIQQALQRQAPHLDLTRYAPDLVATVPTDVLQRLNAQVDHLTLPPGCDVSTVQRWIDHLHIEALTAHDVRPAGALRDSELPGRLAVIHCNVGLLRSEDLATTRRILDLRAPSEAPASGDSQGPVRSSGFSGPAQRQTNAVGTVAQWERAQQLARQCVAANLRPASTDASPEQRAIEREEAQDLLRLLHPLPIELLPMRGQAACRLSCEWLAEGGRSELDVTQARQLEVAMAQTSTAFLIPSGMEHRVAGRDDLAWLRQQRDWVDAGATSRERGIREAGYERDLNLRHRLSQPATRQTPPAAATGPRFTTAMASPSEDSNDDAVDLAMFAYPAPAPVPPDGSPDRPQWEIDGLYSSLPAGDRPASGARGSIGPYDVPPRRPPLGLYDVPPPSSQRTTRSVSRLLQPQPTAENAGPLSPRALAEAGQQIQPFLQWLNRPEYLAAPMRMNISPLQLAPLTRLVRQAIPLAASAPDARRALMACSPLLARIETGVNHRLSRGDATLLAAAYEALLGLPADDRAPPVPTSARTSTLDSQA